MTVSVTAVFAQSFRRPANDAQSAPVHIHGDDSVDGVDVVWCWHVVIGEAVMVIFRAGSVRRWIAAGPAVETLIATALTTIIRYDSLISYSLIQLIIYLFGINHILRKQLEGGPKWPKIGLRNMWSIPYFN